MRLFIIVNRRYSPLEDAVDPGSFVQLTRVKQQLSIPLRSLRWLLPKRLPLVHNLVRPEDLFQLSLSTRRKAQTMISRKSQHKGMPKRVPRNLRTDLTPRYKKPSTLHQTLINSTSNHYSVLLHPSNPVSLVANRRYVNAKELLSSNSHICHSRTSSLSLYLLDYEDLPLSHVTTRSTTVKARLLHLTLPPKIQQLPGRLVDNHAVDSFRVGQRCQRMIARMIWVDTE